jgi:hypothetical protein
MGDDCQTCLSCWSSGGACADAFCNDGSCLAGYAGRANCRACNGTECDCAAGEVWYYNRQECGERRLPDGALSAGFLGAAGHQFMQHIAAGT